MDELGARLTINTPVGKLSVLATSQGVAAVEFQDSVAAEFENDPQAAHHARVAADQLIEYFAGSRSKFELTTHIAGTVFQQAVWSEIAKIPRGKTLSYGQIAQKIGKPKAARAVGAAVGQNPVPIIIGCHRVMGSNGSLTGYSGGEGLVTKRWLLDFEGIEYR